MDTRSFNVLHNAGNENVLSVADGVHFYLRAHQVLIHKHGVFYLLRKYYVHVLRHVRFGIAYLHVLTAQHVGRTEQRGIAYLARHLDCLFLGHDGVAAGALDFQLFQQFVEAFPVLRHVDVFRLRAEYGNILLAQHFGQLYSRLSAESHDHAVRLFRVDYGKHVLVGKRLEIKPVGGVEVGGHGFGVVVDDNHFVPLVFQRPHAVHGSVVEFYALAYSYGTGTEDYHLLLVAPQVVDKFARLVLVVVRGVEVRRLGGKLRRARVDHFIGSVSGIFHLLSAYVFYRGVEVTHFLGAQIQLVGELA